MGAIAVVIDVGKNIDKQWIGRKVGSYASHSAYVALSPEHVRVVPDNVSADDASFFTLAEIVMNGIRRGEVTWGDAVVVYGAGLLGQLAARFCYLAGARPVICIDVSDKRLGLLPNVIKSINSKNEDAVESVSKMTNGRMADVVIEVTGNPDVIPQEFKVLKRQGKIVILSSPRGTTANFDFHDLCNSPSYTIIGAHNASHPPVETAYNQWTQKRHAELFFNFLKDGELDMKPLISHTGSYTEAVKFYQILLEDRTQAMGIVMQWA
jgi:threonine dehydrogenase-like Zn-dependent dehydrogenase